MENLQICGKNRMDTYTNTRVTCRGIAQSNGCVLLSYEVNTDRWFIPGGGLEAGESLQLCCIREMAEETGVLTEPVTHFMTIEEYYADWMYENHYFTCRCLGQTPRTPTPLEIENGQEPRWVPVKEALEIFSQYEAYEDADIRHGLYLREYLALTAFCRLEEGA